MRPVLEICVEDAAGLEAAIDGGADRIELCQALDVGGLTPSLGLMRRAADLGVETRAMIRPRPGDFQCSRADLAVMCADIDAARASGLAGVVLGASAADGGLDLATLRHLAGRAQGMGLTLHRCFDLAPDPFLALEQAVDLGFDRILTSGGALTAAEGAARIGQLVTAAAGRITIIAGSGITDETLGTLQGLGLTEIHASGRAARAQDPRLAAFGFAAETRRETDAARIRALRMRLDRDGIA